MLRNSGKKAVKKLVIKNFKELPQLPANFEEEAWKKLEEAVKAIMEQRAIEESKETLYNYVKDLCSRNPSSPSLLFSRLHLLLSSHLSALSLRLQSPAHPLKGEEYLKEVKEEWERYGEQMRMLRHIFLFLDRSSLLSLSPLLPARSLSDLALHLFSSHLFLSSPSIAERLIATMLEQITAEREGAVSSSRSSLHSLLRMLSSLSLYLPLFEGPFLSLSADYYRNEAREEFGKRELGEYLRLIERRMKEEGERANGYLEKATGKAMQGILEAEFISSYGEQMLEKGLVALLDADRFEDLSLLYSFFHRVHLLPLLEEAFSGYVKAGALEIVLPPETDSSMIDLLLRFKLKLDSILSRSFHSDDLFDASLRKSLHSAINQRENRPAELLAKFLDAKLKSSKSGETEEEMERVLDQVLSIFRLVEGKDVFQAFFRNDLAKRLLLGKSSDFDIEKTLISKLRHECGQAFTHKYEAMFTDMELSKDIMNSFAESKHSADLSPPNFDLTVNILTTGTWPHYPPVELSLPSSLAANQQVFENFYRQKYQGRKLTWLNSMGHCILSSRFPKGHKLLSVSLFQCSVLFLFNSALKLSYRDILSALHLHEKELKLTLQSLACGKIRVLVKSPKGKEIEEGDQFIVNPTFTHKLVRIRINSIQMIETKEERDKTNSNVLVERQYAIDAAIVRIMKERKKLGYTVLVAELYQQLRFPVQPSVIKERVASLIERDYLERDEHNDQILHYLA